MSDLEICRVCLRTGCKMYRYDRFKLKSYYEELLATEVNLLDGLPCCFCYECAALLHKFHKFKIKCNNGQSTLQARLMTSGGITYDAIDKIDRKSINLTYLDVLKASKRVQTFVEKDNTYIESETENSDDADSSDNDDVEMFEAELVKVEGKSERVHTETETVFFEENSVEKKPVLDSDDEFLVSHVVTPTDGQTSEDKIINVCNPKPDHVKDKFHEIKVEIEEESHIIYSDTEKKLIKVVDIETLQQNKIKKISKLHTSDGNRTEKYAKPRMNVIDASLWKCYFLSEEDAWKEFRAQAEEPKYVAAEHKCGKCYTWFRTRDKLKRHNVLKHGSRGKVECQFCAIRFKRPCEVRQHLKKHYKRFECLKCGMKSCSENSAFFHQDMHSGARRRCNFCGKTFRHCSTYYTHLRTHRSNFVCSLCGLSFVSQFGLDIHKKIKHCTPEADDELSDDYDTSVSVYCAKCSIRFESRKAYVEHVFQSAEHDEGNEDELEPLPQPARKILSKTHKKEITCRLKGVKAEGELSKIKSKRTQKTRKYQKKPTTCHQCGISFETQAACLKHHRKEHPYTTFHADAERYICDICGANLAKGSIAMHQNMHSRHVMHTCETCGKTFHAQISLRRHYLTHTGEKPYPCTLCDKRFTQSNSMKLHYRTYHLKQPYPKRNRKTKERKDLNEVVKTAAGSVDPLTEPDTRSGQKEPGTSGTKPGGNTGYLALS